MHRQSGMSAVGGMSRTQYNNAKCGLQCDYNLALRAIGRGATTCLASACSITVLVGLLKNIQC